MTSLRLMTYNIRLGIQEGLDAIVQLVQAHDPDILAIQEVGNNWTMGPTGDTTAYLSQHTALDHAIYVPAILEGDAQYGHALLSKYPLSTLTIDQLEQHEDEPRRLLHSRVHVNDDFQPIILSTHLSWLDSDRPTQAIQLTAAANHHVAAGETVFVMGDLNEHHDVAWLTELCALFHDADRTENRLTYPSKAPKLRLDYLLCQQGAWTNTTIIEDRTTSDHFPVISTWSAE